MEAGVSIGPYRGYVRGVATEAQAQAWLASLGTHVGDGSGTVLTEGRHRNVLLRMPTSAGGCEVVVKAFGCGGLIEPIRSWYRGTKAWRSWLGAVHLREQGVGTPEPLALLERYEGNTLRESYFVTAYLPEAVSFAEALTQLYRDEPDGTKLMALLQTVAEAIRQMHAAGFVHYDLGNQNILLRRAGSHRWEDVCFIDLNRGRIRARVTGRERGRDISRIALPSDFLRVFREMYYGDVLPAAFRTWELRYRRRYAWHARTRRWRHPLREARLRSVPGPQSGYPPPRSIWVWDPLSAQPLVTMQRRERKQHFGWRRHLQAVWSPLRVLPACSVHYRRFLREAYQQPVSFAGRIGVVLEWRAGAQAQTLAALAKLGRIPVFVRFYRHADAEALSGTLGWVRALKAAGHPVAIGLLQDRAAVEDPVLWQTFVDTVLGAVGTEVTLVEVGHAINRVKWGIWTFAEYHDLLAPLVVWRERLPQVRFGGPAVIDFEYAYVAAALDRLPEGMAFDVLTHHLYVDRRGAPENRQGRFALREKLALARAVGQVHPKGGQGLIVSEFNWPLAGTGVHSPVGAPYVSPGCRQNDPSVSEEDAAAYMLRYILIAIGSGLAEQVYWWGLVAHGFGLIDDAGPVWRERPAYRGLQVFLQRVAGRTLVQYSVIPVAGGDIHAYRFRPESPGPDLQILYTESIRPLLYPCPADTAVCDAYGNACPCSGSEVPVGGVPVYVYAN